ncbi:MAG: hypothetical protein L0323_21615 [Planctomycetes bacterium]|nr:hypothetical protein [Planctomycetota bacterium]
MPASFAPRLVRSLVPGFLLAAGACKSEATHGAAPKPAKNRAEISAEFTATAQVVGVARPERIVTLRREDGSQIGLRCGEGVRNFDRIAVGDTLRVRYKETLAATKIPPGQVGRPAEAAVGAVRSKPGEKPGGGLGLAVSLPVRIESIDRERNIVVFSISSGELIAHRIQTSEGREFVAGLAVGDNVQLDYSEGLALAVETL